MAEGEGIVKKVAEAAFKAVEKDVEQDAEKAAAKKAEQAAAKKAEEEAVKKAEREAIAKQVRDTHDPRDLIPADAEQKPFHAIADGSKDGVNYKWQTESGQPVRFRAHSADRNPNLPENSNSRNGPTYRVQVGQRYVGKSGDVHPKNAHDPNSSNYDPGSANDTHIPWPKDIPLPWQE